MIDSSQILNKDLKQTQRPKTIGSFIGSGLRKIDRFGHPISLTYNDEATFTSPFGGFMTVLSVGALLSYFFILLATAINKE